MADPGIKLASKDGAIRLTMPASVANDLPSLQKGLKSLAERIGHPTCFSGYDILHLLHEREFTLDKASKINAEPLRVRPDDITQATNSLGSLTVTLPPKVSGNIDSLNKAIATVMGKLGCAACCSGFDILFRKEQDMLALDESLRVQGFGQFR